MAAADGQVLALSHARLLRHWAACALHPCPCPCPRPVPRSNQLPPCEGPWDNLLTAGGGGSQASVPSAAGAVATCLIPCKPLNTSAVQAYGRCSVNTCRMDKSAAQTSPHCSERHLTVRCHQDLARGGGGSRSGTPLTQQVSLEAGPAARAGLPPERRLSYRSVPTSGDLGICFPLGAAATLPASTVWPLARTPAASATLAVGAGSASGERSPAARRRSPGRREPACDSSRGIDLSTRSSPVSATSYL